MIPKCKIKNDTGWIDMSKYVNSAYFASRPGHSPMARKIKGIIYWRGAVYCYKDTNLQEVNILENLPKWVQFDTEKEFSGTFVTWFEWNYGTMFICDDYVRVGQNSTINAVSNDWKAFNLATISGYPSA